MVSVIWPNLILFVVMGVAVVVGIVALTRASRRHS